MAQPYIVDVNLRIQNIIGLDKFKAALAQTGGAVGVGKGGAKGAGGAIPGGAMVLPDDAANKTITNMNKVGQAAEATGKKVKRAGQSMKATGQSMKDAGAAAQTFGDKMKLAGVRYAAFVVATAVPFAIIASFKNATESVIEFDDALTKLSQILDRSKASLGEYGQEMIRLSVETGTALSDIAKATKILAQAGFLRQGRAEMEKFLEPLAKVPLLASFEGIDQATEGVIAALNQFSSEGLEAVDVLDKLDYVSNQFAITASDLVEGIKRGGGAFGALGGNLDEFIALMTTMRSVTRESGQTIGTSIRTITARMSRPSTIKFLEGLGVEVRDSNGELLGMIETLSNLNNVFERSGKEGKAAIAETLGGFRQISRVLAAIQNPEKIQQALRASQNAAGSIQRNAEKGLGSLAAQLNVLGARWTEFVQSMAEPLFIPLIQSATNFLNIVVKVVSAMGPIIPLFTTLVGFAAGIAALGKSLSLVAAAGGLITKSFAAAGAVGAGMLGSFKGLAAGGLAGLTGRQSARTRIQNRLGGQVGAAGAGAAVAGGIGQVPQLLIATGIFAAMKTLSEGSLEAGNQVGFFAGEIIKSAAAFAIAASLLSGKSIGAIGKGVGGYIGGGAAAGGAAGLGKAALGIGGIGAGLVVAGGLAAAKQANINIDELVKKAADYINDLEIEVTDQESLNEAGGEIGKKLVETVNEAVKEFEGFGGFPANFGERMGRFLRSMGSLIGISEADWSGIAGAIIDEDKIREIFKAMYEKSPETFRGMLDEAIKNAGPDFRNALVTSFASQLPSTSDPRVAGILRSLLIDFTGGEKQAQRKVSLEQQRKAQEAFANESKRIAQQLQDVIIPSQLASQMNIFGSAMDAVTREVELATNTFRELAGNVGQVGAPQIPTEVSLEAIQQGLGKFGFEALMGDFDASFFQEAGEGAQVYAQAAQAMKQLLIDLTATEAAAAGPAELAEGRIDFSDIRQKASAAINDALALFFGKFEGKFPDKYKDAVRQVMESTANEWQSAIQDGMQPDPKQLTARLDEIMKAVHVPTEGLAEGLQQGINAVMQQIQNQIDYEAKRIQLDIGGFQTAESALGDFNYAMGLIGQTGVSWGGSMEKTAASFFRYGGQILSLGDEINALEKKRTATFKQLGQAVKEGSPEAARLAKDFAQLNNRMNELQGFGVKQALKLIEESRQALQQQAQQDVKDIQKGGYDEDFSGRLITQRNEELAQTLSRLDEMAQHLTSTMKVSQLDAVASSAEIYKSASGIFSNAVTEFKKAISDLSRPMRPEEAPGGMGAGNYVINERGELERPEPARTKEQEQALDIQALGQPIEQVTEALKQQLSEQRTLGQDLRNIAVGLLNVGPHELIKAFAGQEAADKFLREELIQLSGFSKEQKETAAKAYAEQVVATKAGEGTGADLNTIENIAANALKVLEQGVNVNRSEFEVSKLSQQRLENIHRAEEATRKAIEQQEPVTIPDDLLKALEAGQRYREEQGIKSIISEAQIGQPTAQITEPQPTDVGLAPPFTGLGQAIAAAVLGAIPTEPAEPRDAEQRVIEISESVKLMQAAAKNIADQGAAGADPGMDFQTGTDSIRMSAENLQSMSDVFSDATNRFAVSNEGVLIANEAFRLGTDSFRMNVEAMSASTDIFRGVVDTMQAVVDLQNQAQIDPTIGGVAEGEAEAGMQQVSTAIESLGSRVDAITEAVGVQTQQAAELATAETAKPLEVDGLSDNTEALTANSETAGKTQEGMSSLNEGVAKVAGAMEEGIGIDIETMSAIKVDVQGISAAAQEFTAEFEAVAHKVAKEEIRAVLQQLARAAGNSEAASTFESALT